MYQNNYSHGREKV